MGMTEEEVDRVLHKLDQCLRQWKRKAQGPSSPPSVDGGGEAELGPEAPVGEEDADTEAKSADVGASRGDSGDGGAGG